MTKEEIIQQIKDEFTYEVTDLEIFYNETENTIEISCFYNEKGTFIETWLKENFTLEDLGVKESSNQKISIMAKFSE